MGTEMVGRQITNKHRYRNNHHHLQPVYLLYHPGQTFHQDSLVQTPYPVLFTHFLLLNSSKYSIR